MQGYHTYNTYATNRVLIKIVLGVTMLIMIAVYRYSGESDFQCHLSENLGEPQQQKDAVVALIKYSINSFFKVDQFI